MLSHLLVSGSERDQFSPSSAVDIWSMARKGEGAALLVIEEMLSHLTFSLYLAHLGPCDNTDIDSKMPVLANSVTAESCWNQRQLHLCAVFKVAANS